MRSAILTTRRVSAVDAVEGIVRGYVFIWGDPDTRDAYGTYFSKDRPPQLGHSGNFVGYPICYEHGQDGTIGVDTIGAITRTWYDDTGLAFEARLDKSGPHFERVIGEVLRGEQFTSSSTGPHVADFYDDGAFRSWLLTELSLTKYPAEHRMPATTLVRSHNQQEVRMLPQQSAAVPAPEQQTRDLAEMLQQMVDAGYTLEEIMAAIQELSGASAGDPAAMPEEARSLVPQLRAALEQRLTATRSEQRFTQMQTALTSLTAEVTALRNAPPEPQTDRFVRGGTESSVSVSEPRKYWQNDDRAMLFAHMVMRSQNIQPSQEFLTVLGGRAQTAIEKSDPLLADRYVRSMMPSTRANEVAISTAAGGGDEWVAIAWSTDIWAIARSNLIYEQLVSKGMIVKEVPQGHESVYVLTEGADPTVYTIAQDADLASGRPDVNVGATRIGTGRVLLTPGELGMAVVWSDVFEEDSIINVASQYNQQMQRKAEETVEQLFINGDTVTSTTNINYDDGTPGTGLSTPYYIASNGAIKYALVTGSGTSRSGGALDENDFRLTVKLMSSAIRTRRNETVFILDPDTHSAALNISAIKTDDVRQTNATITSGMLTNIYGYDVLESGMMATADTDGKITYNGNVTETGRILCVHAPYWAVGSKRKITLETDRDILSGTNIVVAKMPIGFMPRGVGASTITYNVTLA